MSQFPDFVLEGETLYISCAVNYSGLMAPDFQWYPTPENILPLNDTGSTINSTVEVNVTSNVVQQYTCFVTFDGSIFPYAANQTSTQINTSSEYARTSTTGMIPLLSSPQIGL